MGEYLPISATDFPQFLSSNSQSHNLQQFCQKLNCHQMPWEASRNIYQAKILVILSSRYVKVNCLVRHSADQCFTYTGGQIQEVKSPFPAIDQHSSGSSKHIESLNSQQGPADTCLRLRRRFLYLKKSRTWKSSSSCRMFQHGGFLLDFIHFDCWTAWLQRHSTYINLYQHVRLSEAFLPYTYIEFT